MKTSQLVSDEFAQKCPCIESLWLLLGFSGVMKLVESGKRSWYRSSLKYFTVTKCPVNITNIIKCWALKRNLVTKNYRQTSIHVEPCKLCQRLLGTCILDKRNPLGYRDRSWCAKYLLLLHTFQELHLELSFPNPLQIL